MFIEPRFQSICGLSGCILPSRVKVNAGIPEREDKAILSYNEASLTDGVYGLSSTRDKKTTLLNIDINFLISQPKHML